MSYNDIEKTIEKMKDADYQNSITVLTPNEARSWLEELADANGEELTDEDVFGGKVPSEGLIIYALPKNGEGKAFIYDAESKYANIERTCSNALEYAYEN